LAKKLKNRCFLRGTLIKSAQKRAFLGDIISSFYGKTLKNGLLRPSLGLGLAQNQRNGFFDTIRKGPFYGLFCTGTHLEKPEKQRFLTLLDPVCLPVFWPVLHGDPPKNSKKHVFLGVFWSKNTCFWAVFDPLLDPALGVGLGQKQRKNTQKHVFLGVLDMWVLVPPCQNSGFWVFRDPTGLGVKNRAF